MGEQHDRGGVVEGERMCSSRTDVDGLSANLSSLMSRPNFIDVDMAETTAGEVDTLGGEGGSARLVLDGGDAGGRRSLLQAAKIVSIMRGTQM